MSEDEIVRHSQAEAAPLLNDPEELARKEAANALRQARRMDEIILASLDGDRPFKIRPSMLLDLNRLAIEGINSYAGNYRPAGVSIGQSKHEPPGAHLVPSLVEDMCDYVNDHWDLMSSVHLAAYVLCRTNWIHPFADGNGRTARASSYVVLCAKAALHLPGVNTIPEQIVNRRFEYYASLEKADQIHKNETAANPVEELEELLNGMLADQLLSSHLLAIGA